MFVFERIDDEKTEPDDEGGANERVICCRSDDFVCRVSISETGLSITVLNCMCTSWQEAGLDEIDDNLMSWKMILNK